MRVVKADAVVMDEKGLSPYKVIEKIGRTCYKSEDLITDTSAEKFVQGLISRQHWAMLEHYNLIFRLTGKNICKDVSAADLIGCFADPILVDGQNLLKYIHISEIGNELWVSGSFRAFHDLFKYISEVEDIYWGVVLNECKELYPLVFDDIHEVNAVDEFNIEYFTRDEFIAYLDTCDGVDAEELATYHLTHTIKFTCDRGVSHELVRHRPCGFAQESTRYCNYSRDKFGNEITFIEPCFWVDDSKSDMYKLWTDACLKAEEIYFKMLNDGASPQEARSVLPNSLKTDIIVTAIEDEWLHILNLRYKGTTGKPHPQMVEVMTIAYNYLVTESNNRLEV